MKKICLFIILFIFFSVSFSLYTYYSNVETLSYYGSTGEEVRNIQSRLKSWGYYKGTVDGVYGWRTSQAVRSFQSKNGLRVDGVAGDQTLAAIGLPTSSSAVSRNEGLMARLINGEARGETYVGQVAVGAVILNRVSHPAFPKSIPSVIYQPGAFTAVSDGQIHANMTTTAVRAADDALSGWDPTYNSIYYFNPATATNKWIWSRPQTIRIGKHIFCK